MESIAVAYWRPVYKYLRLRWRMEREDAEDLTQDFFAQAISRELFARFDPSVARFRTYLRACVDSSTKNSVKANSRQKRGGGAVHLALDFVRAEGELSGVDVPDERDLDDFFRREWLRSLFSLAVEDLRAHCATRGKETHFALFARYDLGADRETYAELGAKMGVSATQVTNHLPFARRQFRTLLLHRLRSLCGSDAEFREEARELLGFEVS
ncbi:MAG: sigma-70 family RNA polymerase sigma factor [Gemmatimonadota bacterium]|nr:sigma-70 family RNA polymerase sigma factor [Gemmatimonadota bacterium]